jgi:hypothetical protein
MGLRHIPPPNVVVRCARFDRFVVLSPGKGEVAVTVLDENTKEGTRPTAPPSARFRQSAVPAAGRTTKVQLNLARADVEICSLNREIGRISRMRESGSDENELGVED